ncbi:class I SAM-dependent methyltransferase [Gammaproteobacteria bacterium]|nr:class I SAM-dependent methyltransferase [Gammaproteobacteria bacterium]
MRKILELGDVPFYWRVKSSPEQMPDNIPARLPFAFDFDEDLQLLIQHRDNKVLDWLEHVYKEDANVGYLQEGHALAASYGGEFIEFFSRALKLLPKKPASAADIGCGGVYLLQKVREMGIAVKGIDPSPVTAVTGAKAGIDIVPDFYPSSALTERFDVLFHYDVLEHVENPVEFLRAHHANLTSTGVVIFAVPDCTHHIRLGDVSMVLHEHLNYFDEESLANVVRTAGFEPLLLAPANHGGVLLCCAVKSSVDTTPRGPFDSAKYDEFCMRVDISLERFHDYVRQSDGGELGLYVPLRAFPYLGFVGEEQRLRFFDDDPALHRCFYDGFTVRVENRVDLISNPPEKTLICSLSFGDRISEKIPSNIKILKWAELFE